MDVSREQVLGFRLAAQGLLRDGGPAGELAVLDLGVQQAMGHPASLALAARLPIGADVLPPVGPGCDLALAWTFRGSPHVHRRRDLAMLAAALVPLSEADAAGRLTETGPSVARAGIPALEQYRLAAQAMQAAVSRPTAKGAVSTAVSQQLPAAMLRDCRPCKARHVSDSAMRTTALAAGLELDPDTAPPVLVPWSGALLPLTVDRAALTTLARRYLALLGPADAGDFAGHLGARRADVAAAWPHDLVDVRLAGRPVQVLAETVDALRSAPSPKGVVRLLGGFDPYVPAGERRWLVPDPARRSALWPVLGRPGVLLVDGELAGTWRAKQTKSRLTLTVSPFVSVGASTWAAVEAESAAVAAARHAPAVAVVRA